MASSCLFCRLVAGEIPSKRVGEGPRFLSILDAFPMSHGHVLVLPKEHFGTWHELPPDVLADLVQEGRRLALLLAERLGVKHYNVVMNNGEAAGQSVPHAHLHLIPRVEGDGVVRYRSGDKLDSPTAEALAEIFNRP